MKGAFVLCIAAFAAAMVGCGEKPKGKGGGGRPRVGHVEGAFLTAAGQTGIPARFLMAAAYVESGLQPKNATANYVSTGGGEEQVARGTVMTQTAFGLTFGELGLDPAKADSALLEVQVDAYAKWIAGQVAGLNLPANPHTPDEKFAWIENLARLHRQGMQSRRNVQILFARELVATLNEGFTWQDPDRAGEALELTKETPPIDIEAMPKTGQQYFRLMEDPSPQGIYLASFLPLVTVSTGEFQNKPKRVEIIHCPLSLSSCLELQTRTADSEVHLAAHYLIAPDDKIVNKIVQVADHSEALIVTNNRGEHLPVTDAVLIMLVGNSGRNVGGERQPAIPTWFTDTQLTQMGRLVEAVCTLLSKQDGEVSRDACMSASGDKGVRFRNQGPSEEYRWGDIADFDPTIFEAYIRAAGRLETEVAFEFWKDYRRFRAGERIPLTVQFNSTAKSVELERLARCRDGKVIWEPVRTLQVRGERKVVFEETLYDGGPNKNGDQFYRARIYGKDAQLLGWSIDRVYLTGYEADDVFASEKHCDD